MAYLSRRAAEDTRYDRELGWLFIAYTAEIAIVFLSHGFRWWVLLLAPSIAACGPRYWKSKYDQVLLYRVWVTIWGIAATYALVRWSRKW